MPSSPGDARNPVELLADEFLARLKRGERPTIREYCDRHPELAEEIRDVFEAVLMVEDLKPGTEDVCRPAGDPVRVGGKRLTQVGDYRILGEIGRGGMGVVYEAEQQALGRRVALKVLPRAAAGDGSAQVRFQREARAAARMHHTNIVPVFDVGRDGDHLYYAMQLIHGQGLDLVIADLKRLRAQGPADGAGPAADRSIAASLAAGRFEREDLAAADPNDPDGTAAYEGSAPSAAVLPGRSELSSATSNRVAYFRSVAQIGVQTASALAYAHGKGIIHRDIKPGNLILDTTGNVWVTDFGLAKTGDDGVTHTGDILGTIRYMSPERFRGQCDVRADVYALGMTLYELLTLKAAFSSGDRLKLIELIRQTEAVGPRAIDPRIPLDLETVVMKAIDKDPKRRYQSADEMGEDLQRFVNDEPIRARRVGQAERFARWCRHHPAVAGLVAAVLALMAAGTAVSGWQAVVATDARTDALKALAEKEAALAEKVKAAAESRAVLQFFDREVLAAGRPAGQDGGLGRDVTLHKAIDAAEPKIASAFRDQPLAEASIRASLGQTYYHLGEWRLAIAQHERALGLRREHLGDRHPDTLTSLNYLADLYWEVGDLDRGITMHEEVLSARTAELGPDHLDTLESTHNLGVACWEAGQLNRAAGLLERILKARTDRLGPRDLDTLITTSSLCLVYRDQGAFDRALPLAEHLVETARAALGADAPDTLVFTNNLATVCLAAGQIDRAVTLHERVLEYAQTKWSDHPRVYYAMTNLALAYQARGDLKRAVPLHEQAVARLNAKLGPDHPRVLRNTDYLGAALREAGDPGRAVTIHEQTQAVRVKRLAPDHPDALNNRNDLAAAHLALKNWVRAEEILTDVVRRREAKQPDGWRTWFSRAQLGAALAGQGKRPEAERLLLQGFEGMDRHAGMIPAPSRKCLTETAERLAQVYEELGQKEDAATWRKKLADRRP